MNSKLSFTVLGRPQPAGSKRGFQHPQTGKIILVDDAKNSRPWKQQVAGAAEHAVRLSWARPEVMWSLRDGRAMRLDVLFVVGRPKGHYGTGRNAGLVRDSAPAFPTVKPDATKLLRAVEDAMTGVVWRDDAQVVEQTARKVYGEPERVEVTVTTLDRMDAPAVHPPGQEWLHDGSHTFIRPEGLP